MELKQIYRKSLIRIIFCLSMIFGLILTNSILGTGIASAAEINWNIGTDGNLVITSGGEYHVTGSTQANTITVDTADPVIVTLDNVSIDVSQIAGKCAFDSGASVTVYLKGANILKSGGMSEDKIGQPGLKNQENDNLVIGEDPVNHGSLTATGGNRGAGIGGEGGKTGGSVTIYNGTVTAIGGLGAAGIGGGGNVFLNNQYVSAGGYGGLVTVNGGTITATGGYQGAGIGGGVGNESATNVDTGVTRINGGTVNATGGDLGAGIGGGCYSSNGSVFIDAGIVTATGGPGAAGIGGGHVGSGGTVTIRGGNLTANGGGSAAGIGGGVYGSGAVVEIENGTVIANGGGGAAGIGSGASSLTNVTSGTVHIINGTVTSTGGSGGGAGIGGGSRNNGAVVTIDGGTVTAIGGSRGAGIGGGESSIVPGGTNVITDGGTLTVNDGSVTATGGQYSAGIGGGYWGSGAEVVINDGSVEAYGSGWGAGIGGGGYGGQYGTVGTVTIYGGYVQAEGGEYAAGIGGGYLQVGGTVAISGGEVIARGGADAAGIGGGREKAGGTVTITGGSITASGGSYSAGIGGGAYGIGGTVTISNGTVTAVGGTNGAGIGAGFNSPGGTVTITGGSIKASGNNSDDIGGSGSAKGTGVITNGTESLDCRIMEDSVAEEDPELVTIQLTVTRSTPYDYSYIYNYTGKGHGDGDTSLYFYLPVRIVTDLSLESSQNPSTWGDTVTLTAELDHDTATGSVKFFDEDVLLGTATLNDGYATFDSDSLLPGTHTLRAEYLGDEFYAPSTSDDLMQTVNKLQTIITLDSSQNPAPIGAAITFTATVDQVDASGAVEFYDGESLIDTIDIVDGIAVLTTSDLILGTHPISATYQGDSYYASGDSNVVEQVITKIPTYITLTSSLNPSSLGATVTFTATINPLTAVGSIDFYDNGMWVGETAITDGNAVFVTYYSMTLSSHSITATYGGNEIYAPGCTGTPLSQQILNSTTGGGSGGGGTSGGVTSTTVKVGNSSTLLPYNAVGSTIYANITQKILDNLLNMGLKEKGLNFDLSGISQAKQLVLPSDAALFEAKYLIVGFPEISLNFDQDTLAALQEESNGGAITITGKKVDKSELNQDQQKKVGDNQVYEITVLAGGERVADLGGQITATIPYTLKEGEDADHITIWCLKETGELEEIHCSYDIVTCTVTFVTDHLSYYVVGYQEASIWANPFSDVAENDWYYDAIVYTNQHGMLNGVTATTFGPNDTTTRGMVVTVLWRIAGEPTAGESGFSDVKAGAWYYDAVTWAAQKGIVKGMGGGLFKPEAGITREQLAAILYNYANFMGYDTSEYPDTNSFSFDDASSISDYALSALKWASASGLFEGNGGKLDPQGKATRAQVAVILMRMMERVIE